MTQISRKKKNKRRKAWLLVMIILLAGGFALKFYGGAEKAGTIAGKKTGEAPNEQVKTSMPDSAAKVQHSDQQAKQHSNASTRNQQQRQVTKDILQGKQSTEAKVEALLKHMTLREKVGQLMMVGFYGTKADEKISRLIREQKVGGVILFDRNMQNPGQVARLTNQLQSAVSQNDLSLPLLISTDQEGGPVLRMREHVSPIPSEQELGMKATPEEVYRIARVNGEELAAMGIQLDLAPVLDLSGSDDRSFGSNPAKGFNLGLQAVKGLNNAHVTATIKHFPGNGKVVVDPHLDTSIVKADKNTLENVDMVPFKRMIQRQADQQFFVMVTHVKYPAFDPDMPASISKPIITGLLRGELGYKGIVITDDLDMGAVSKYYSYDQLGYMALAAGADILLVCHEYNHQLELYNGILKAVQTRKISEDRINESVKRVLTFKLNQLPNRFVSEKRVNQVVKSTEHLNIIQNYKN